MCACVPKKILLSLLGLLQPRLRMCCNATAVLSSHPMACCARGCCWPAWCNTCYCCWPNWCRVFLMQPALGCRGCGYYYWIVNSSSPTIIYYFLQKNRFQNTLGLGFLVFYTLWYSLIFSKPKPILLECGLLDFFFSKQNSVEN